MISSFAKKDILLHGACPVLNKNFPSKGTLRLILTFIRIECNR